MDQLAAKVSYTILLPFPRNLFFHRTIIASEKKQKPRNDSNGTITSLGQILMGSRKLMHINLVGTVHLKIASFNCAAFG